MRNFISTFLVTVLLPRPSLGLASPSQSPARRKLPELKTLAPTIYGTKLNYRITVGDKETPFPISNLHVELSSDCKTPTSPRATGIHDATILSLPTFVNDDGLQTVPLQNGGWQVEWNQKGKNGSPHGFLVCSFVTPTDVLRNDKKKSADFADSEKRQAKAKLDKGRFFVYHRCWTRETLASERERRIAVQDEAAKALGERDAKVREITDEEGRRSVASKVVSYAKAAKSMNDYRESGIKEASYIPLYDKQVLPLTKECIVSSRGLVYKVSTDRRRQFEYIGESRVDYLEPKQADDDATPAE